MKSKFTFLLILYALLGACQAQNETDDDVDLNTPIAQKNDVPSESDVCNHWVFLAPVVHENIKMGKEFMPQNYMENIEESYEMNEIHPSSGGYSILRAMLDAADQGKSVAEIEQLALSVCRSYPEDAVDDAGGAYEAFEK